MIRTMEKLLIIAVVITVTTGILLVKAEHSQAAYEARKMISQIDWVTITSISTKPDIEGYPMGNMKSMSDGPKGNSSGIPYFFTSDIDLSSQDFLVNNNATAFATMASTNYCRDNDFDPQDPRCPRLFLTGSYVKVRDNEERKYAMKGLLEKHPVMESWAQLPDFYVAKLDLTKIVYLGNYGPTTEISLFEYLTLDLNAHTFNSF